MTINAARKALSIYEKAAPMIHTGLYAKGSSEEIDEAISVFSKLELFFARNAPETINESFTLLAELLNHPD